MTRLMRQVLDARTCLMDVQGVLDAILGGHPVKRGEVLHAKRAVDRVLSEPVRDTRGQKQSQRNSSEPWVRLRFEEDLTRVWRLVPQAFTSNDVKEVCERIGLSAGAWWQVMIRAQRYGRIERTDMSERGGRGHVRHWRQCVVQQERAS